MGFFIFRGRKMKRKETINHNHNAVTTVTFLNRHQVDYLDRLGKDCFFKFGHKLPRTKVLSELVNLLMDIHLSIKDIDLDHETLCEGIIHCLEKSLKEKELKGEE